MTADDGLNPRGFQFKKHFLGRREDLAFKEIFEYVITSLTLISSAFPLFSSYFDFAAIT